MNERTASRLLYAFALLPLFVIAGLSMLSWIPARWQNLYLLLLFGGVLTFVCSVPIRAHRQRERAAGLVPEGGGFSSKLDRMAEKLREKADAVESGDVSGFGSVFESFVTELRRLAEQQDHRQLVPRLVLDIDEDASPKEVASYAAQLRAAAGEVELYAQDVRARGGIFRLSMPKLVAGAIVLLAMASYGAKRMWELWDKPGFGFFGGALLVTAAVVIGCGLVLSQRQKA